MDGGCSRQPLTPLSESPSWLRSEKRRLYLGRLATRMNHIRYSLVEVQLTARPIALRRRAVHCPYTYKSNTTTRHVIPIVASRSARAPNPPVPTPCSSPLSLRPRPTATYLTSPVLHTSTLTASASPSTLAIMPGIQVSPPPLSTPHSPEHWRVVAWSYRRLPALDQPLHLMPISAMILAPPTSGMCTSSVRCYQSLTLLRSGFDHHVTAQFPGVSCASTPEEDLLWGNCDTNLSAEAPVNIDSLNSLTVTSPSLLTAARPAIDPLQALDPAELWQGYYDSAHAFAPYESAYLSSSSQSPTNSSPASDWAGIFSPAASPETTASSSIVPSPEPTTFAPSPPASANRQSRKATPHVGRVRSSASRHTKPYPSIPSFANRCARSTASRNKQIPADEITESVCRGGMEFCSNCSYQTRRKGDMRRHMKTHSGTTEYICCGVPVKDIPGYVGKTRYHEGREMAGGCLKAFRRKDSFLRHLKVSGGTCIRPTCLGSS